MATMEPFLRPDDIPSSLWIGTHDNGPGKPKGILTLPSAVQSTYRKLLRENGLLKLAQDTSTRDSEGPVGGSTLQETQEHFAKSYSGSCGRVQLFALDPRRTFDTTFDSFIQLFSGGTVRLLDLPCGAGAASAVLLSIIAELRQASALPRHPLKVRVIGGDISTHATDFAESIHRELDDWWSENGIEAGWEFVGWDVLDVGDTSDVLSKWRDGASSGDRHAIVTANFSGFLGETVVPGQAKRRFDEAVGSVQSIFAEGSRLGSVIYWIEPPSNSAKNVFTKIESEVLNKCKRLRHLRQPFRWTQAQLRDPVIRGGDFVVRSSGLHLETKAR